MSYYQTACKLQRRDSLLLSMLSLHLVFTYTLPLLYSPLVSHVILLS